MHATAHHARVRWTLGVGLRRPAEKDYPADQYNVLEFDEIVLDVLREEYLAASVIAAVTEIPLKCPDIAQAIGEKVDIVSSALTDMMKEGRIIIKGWEDRHPLYMKAV